MTNEQAIRALVDAARQWVDLERRSQFGSGYRNSMRDVLNTLSHCPTGAAAIRGEVADSVQMPKKQLPTRNRPKRR